MQLEELIEESNQGAITQEIESFEKELNIKLPQDIKELYLKYDGFYIKEDYEVSLDNDDCETLVRRFIELKFIKNRINAYLHRKNYYDSLIETYFIEKKVLPIAITDTEYYEIGISIDQSSKYYGAFFLLPYEAEDDFCKIADNLQDFLNKFKKVDD